jgi:hypothetical protein
MNIIIEDNIDFYKELNNIDTNSEEDNIEYCLLSKLPLDKNKIKLSCGHEFNFIPLFKEVCKQKCKGSFLEISKLCHNEIKCPYCRQKQKQLLPHVKMTSKMLYISGINSPENLCMDFHTCEYIYKSGKNKGSYCAKTAYYDVAGCFCNTHQLRMLKKMTTSVKDEKNNLEEEDDDFKPTFPTVATIQKKKDLKCKKCIAILKSGKRKGEACGAKIGDGSSEYCGRHTSK